MRDHEKIWRSLGALLFVACGSDEGSARPDASFEQDAASVSAAHESDASVAQGDDGGSSDAGVEPGGACDTSAQCAQPQTCHVAACIGGKCVAARQPEGTALAPESQPPGDCLRLVCDGMGSLSVLVDDTDRPAAPTDPCKVATCSAGKVVTAPVPAGTPLPESAQTAGDCITIVCDDLGQPSTKVDEADRPNVVGACMVAACEASTPVTGLADVGSDCGTSGYCGANGACNACREPKAACTNDYECCEGICGSEGACVEKALPPECLPKTHGDKTYWMCDVTLKWDDARAACTAAGHDLAVIDDEEENEFLGGLVLVRSFIGLSDRAVEGSFMWVDGRSVWEGGQGGNPVPPSAFTAWEPIEMEPNNSCRSSAEPELCMTQGQDCGVLLKGGHWDDYECRLPQSFLCESK